MFEKFSIFVHMNLIDRNIDEITKICKAHHVDTLFVFGSAKTDHFNETSDIDLVVQFMTDIDPCLYFSNYMTMKEKMEHLFRRDVDLVENQSIKNPVFKRIVAREKELVYDRTHRKIVENIYSVIVNHLPLLRTEVQQLLKQLPSYYLAGSGKQD